MVDGNTHAHAHAHAIPALDIPSVTAPPLKKGQGQEQGQGPDEKSDRGQKEGDDGQTEKQHPRWNTRNLGLRLGADAASAATAASLVAPIICIIDRSIVTKAATGTPILTCLSQAIRPAARHPIRFLASRPFLLIFGLYFATYSTANTIDTLTATLNPTADQAVDGVTSTTAKFVATSAVNMTACVYKDSQFARLFGSAASASSSASSGSPVRAIPKLSYALFAARDCLTIFASFNLPSIIAPKLQHLPPGLLQHASFLKPLVATEAGRLNTAQFVAPAAIQIFSTPIHLLGLDLYNRPAGEFRLSLADRGARIMRDWGVSALARMARIVPAFGVGGVVNGNMRRELMASL